jgi:hypothetical protein
MGTSTGCDDVWWRHDVDMTVGAAAVVRWRHDVDMAVVMTYGGGTMTYGGAVFTMSCQLLSWFLPSCVHRCAPTRTAAVGETDGGGGGGGVSVRRVHAQLVRSSCKRRQLWGQWCSL